MQKEKGSLKDVYTASMRPISFTHELDLFKIRTINEYVISLLELTAGSGSLSEALSFWYRQGILRNLVESSWQRTGC